MVAAAGIVSVVNYGYTLALIWMLPARQYAVVGSASALLLICGTISGASIPWVLSREVASGHDDPRRRRAAVSFCLVATAVQSVAAGLATCLIALHYADNATVAAVFASVAMIFTAATAVGYLQGLERFGLITGLKIAEVVVKVGLGLGLVALGVGASGAIAGFAVGAAVVAGVSLAVMKPDLHWVRDSLADRGLWPDTRRSAGDPGRHRRAGQPRYRPGQPPRGQPDQPGHLPGGPDPGPGAGLRRQLALARGVSAARGPAGRHGHEYPRRDRALRPDLHSDHRCHRLAPGPGHAAPLPVQLRRRGADPSPRRGRRLLHGNHQPGHHVLPGVESLCADRRAPRRRHCPPRRRWSPPASPSTASSGSRWPWPGEPR